MPTPPDQAGLDGVQIAMRDRALVVIQTQLDDLKKHKPACADLFASEFSLQSLDASDPEKMAAAEKISKVLGTSFTVSEAITWVDQIWKKRLAENDPARSQYPALFALNELKAHQQAYSDSLDAQIKFAKLQSEASQALPGISANHSASGEYLAVYYLPEVKSHLLEAHLPGDDPRPKEAQAIIAGTHIVASQNEEYLKELVGRDVRNLQTRMHELNQDPATQNSAETKSTAQRLQKALAASKELTNV